MLENSFNAVEVLEMAKDIEKRGYDFYIGQAKKVKGNLVELFGKLADDELDHCRRFEELIKMVKKDTRRQAEYVYNPEVSAYLAALVEFSVFPKSQAEQVETVEEALTVAINAEKDSILFYQEMLDNNQGEAARVIRKLIEEEKQHLLDLVKFNEEFKQ
ncbi:MAG: ferritin family protein [Halanaerobiales bacterium]|nr:ferritin family protein [Halanaerobiales bacterium]